MELCTRLLSCDQKDPKQTALVFLFKTYYNKHYQQIFFVLF